MAGLFTLVAETRSQRGFPHPGIRIKWVTENLHPMVQLVHPITFRESFQEAFMWIVALALRRPYTFVVVALLLLILGPIVITELRLTYFRISTFPSSAFCGTTPV